MSSVHDYPTEGLKRVSPPPGHYDASESDEEEWHDAPDASDAGDDHKDTSSPPKDSAKREQALKVGTFPY